MTVAEVEETVKELAEKRAQRAKLDDEINVLDREASMGWGMLRNELSANKDFRGRLDAIRLAKGFNSSLSIFRDSQIWAEVSLDIITTAICFGLVKRS